MAAEAVAGSDGTTALERGPFVLQPLLTDIPLSADGTEQDICINCVDYYDGNLYVGTSASELLHFVQIPPDPNDEASTSTFMLASRLSPPFTEAANPPGPARPGVQQIVLLPPVGKACVLCNWTVTFYSLPELTPVFRDVKNCNWIGGVDLSEELAPGSSPRVTVLLSLNRRLQVVRIGEEARAIKNIDFAASMLSVRRDAIACVADAKNYALVHVEQQLKIPLMSICSLDKQPSDPVVGRAQSLQVLQASAGDTSLSRSASSAESHTRSASTATQQSAHSRSTSLGSFIASSGRSGSVPPPPPPKGGSDEEASGMEAGAQQPATVVSRSSAAGGGSDEAGPPSAAALPLPPPPPPPPPKPAAITLKPLVVSPTPEEFLIVTGTGPLDPGIGMFVNLDGDPTRPTLEFERYPSEIVVDGGVTDLSSSRPSPGGGGPGDEEEDGYVLASISKDYPDGLHYGLEIQRWDVNVGEDEAEKFWLETPQDRHVAPVGLHGLLGHHESVVCEIVDRLAQKRFSLPQNTTDEDSPAAASAKTSKKKRPKKEAASADKTAPDAHEQEDASRNRAEVVFATRLAKTTGRIAVWSGDRIWWAMRNPVALQLEAGLDAASSGATITPQTADERRALFGVLKSLRGRDAKTELEFVTFSYIRQRGGALLFMGLPRVSGQDAYSDAELKALEEVLLDSGLDPRAVLALLPELRGEIVQSERGIWIFGGVKETLQKYLLQEAASASKGTVASLGPKVLQFLRRFLMAWRKKKGFGSVADESDVFRTVDAALLSVLLELDRATPKGVLHVKSDSVRADLNDVVDKGVACFDRAVALLEAHHRLFVLSRLYQSRKMAGDVLATWQRIVEGERDDGGELVDGEHRIRDYLSKVSNQALVQEYGLWLAQRNAKLAVQVFADDKARAPRFEPTQVVQLLRDNAPGAVPYYLEHLVFAKGHAAYVDELISYYLEVVTGGLQSSSTARDTMAASYEAYRALQPPKPTFHQFLTDNAVPGDEAWQSRLRLLELLGGPHPYDVAAIRARLARPLPGGQPAEHLLVPETIIVNGREHRHEDALRLLVHGLGDYDTAIKYCLLGGSSLYNTAQQASAAARGRGAERLPKRRESLPPTVEAQAKLFRALLLEFLAIEDVSDRVEQTGSLLGRFAGWFDVLDVLQLLPDSWAVEVASGFLVHSLRELVRDRNQTTVARALSGAENLRVHDELIKKMDEKGPQIETEN